MSVRQPYPTTSNSTTATTAAAVIPDNLIVRGDGGARGIQDSLVKIDDSGNLIIKTASTGYFISDSVSYTAYAGFYGLDSGNSVAIRCYQASPGKIYFGSGNAGVSITSPLAEFNSQTLLASSGTAATFSLYPTYNQTSTAGATDFLINRTQTAIGSGVHLLFDAQVGGTSRFMVKASGPVGIGTTTPGVLYSTSYFTTGGLHTTDAIIISHANPYIVFDDTGEAANARVVDFFWNAGTFSMRKYNDDGSSSSNIYNIIRSSGFFGINDTPTTRFQVTDSDNTTVVTIKISATQANVTASDTFIDFRSTTGSEGTIAGTAVAGVLAYNTFTGSHYTQIIQEDRKELLPEMLLEIVNEKPLFEKKMNFYEASNKSQIFKSRICRTKGSKAAIGVYGGTDKEGRDMCLSIGTGFITVVNKGKNVEIGDYLESSDVAGCAELQKDDIYRISTVAKATESIVWKAGELSRRISVIYLGG